ncbi:hypothetical protein [uncultured Sphaerotilus sp.]|uniref:hypothetical protein n=1 Tax=uncultured Sphaerotilus sp. TaxID=474984 RepID=UPI0030CA2114
MQTEALINKRLGRKPRDKSAPRTFTPLALETRTHITTAEAAHHLNLSEQTLRTWACFETGAIRPHRIPGVNALQWPVVEIRRALGLEVVQ